MKPLIGVAGIAVMSATLVACGGGGSGSVNAPPPAPLSSPNFSFTSIPLSTSTTTAAQLSYGGTSANVTFPVVSAKANATVYFESTLPGGIAAPQVRTISAKSRIPEAIGGSNLNVLDYVTVSVDSTVTISQTPAFSFTLSSAPSGSAYIAMFDPKNAANGWNVILGPGAVSGNTVSFASQTLAPSLQLQAGDGYVFALITASGVATPTPIPVYPGGAGSTFSFSGSQTQTDTYTYPTPSPLPPTSVTSSITEQVSVGSSPFPSGTPAVADLHEALTVAGPLASQVTNTDAWYGITTVTAPGLAIFGEASTDNANNAMTQIYTTPNTIDLLPELNGSKWTNSPAGTTNATFADGSTLTRTDNADGSFSETTTVSTLRHGYTFILAGNADGSGSYSGTGLVDVGLTSIAASAPSGGTINISVVPSGSSTPVVIAQPVAWFTAGTPLYSESDVETTNSSYPSACSVPSQFGFIGTHISQTIDRIDPMIGTHEHIVNDTYNGALGPVCMTLSDTLTENYDYLMDTWDSAPVADFSGNAVHVTAISQTLTLQNANVKSAVKAQSATAALSPTAIAATRAQFALRLARVRHDLVNKTIKRIEAKIKTGGVK